MQSNQQRIHLMDKEISQIETPEHRSVISICVCAQSKIDTWMRF